MTKGEWQQPQEGADVSKQSGKKSCVIEIDDEQSHSCRSREVTYWEASKFVFVGRETERRTVGVVEAIRSPCGRCHHYSVKIINSKYLSKMSNFSSFLPTPLFPHLRSCRAYKDVYEPAEDSFLLMDALEQEATILNLLR